MCSGVRSMVKQITIHAADDHLFMSILGLLALMRSVKL
jgi:hypothetical protein